MMRRILLAAAAMLFSFAVLADEAQIRKALEAKLGGAKVDGVQATPIPGIFEVRFQSRNGPQIV
jgi:thiol:disulfide interchange protein DsbC